MPTLSQRLGFFPSESRAEILPRCRRDYPLPPPINRGWVYGLREDKIGSKISQKISLFPVSATFSLFFCFSFSLHRCNHRQHTITGLPTTSSTTETFSWTNRRLPVVEQTPRLSPLLPLLLLPAADFLLLLLLLSSSAVNVSSSGSAVSNQHHHVLPRPPASHHCVCNKPPWTSLSPLQIASFYSSSSCSRSSHLQPTPPPFPPLDSGHPPPPVSHHRHARWSATLPLVLRLPRESSTVHKWTVDVNYNSRPQFQWTK